MKHIHTTLFNFLNEDKETTFFGETQQQRFDRAIYLTYVEQHKDRYFKPVSKEKFYDKLEKLLDNKKIVQFDLKRIYRLADEKETWYSKNNKILGEIWREADNIESYWINIE